MECIKRTYQVEEFQAIIHLLQLSVGRGMVALINLARPKLKWWSCKTISSMAVHIMVNQQRWSAEGVLLSIRLGLLQQIQEQSRLRERGLTSQGVQARNQCLELLVLHPHRRDKGRDTSSTITARIDKWLILLTNKHSRSSWMVLSTAQPICNNQFHSWATSPKEIMEISHKEILGQNGLEVCLEMRSQDLQLVAL